MPSGSDLTANSNNQMDTKLNDLVAANGICGVLQKWVNYGKGWKPRWFLLEDGVISYYKIHGHRKVFVHQDTFKGFRIIGDDSNKRILRSSSKSSNNSKAGIHDFTPVGQVHLKVSFSTCVFFYVCVSYSIFQLCFCV